MNTKLSILLLLLIFTQPAWAEELSIHYTFIQSQSDQYSTQGQMEVTVFNQTTGELRNVDIRLQQPGGAIENGIFQLGAIPGGEAGVHSGYFQFPGDIFNSGEPILFRVDYDNATGMHSKIIVPATRLGAGE